MAESTLQQRPDVQWRRLTRRLWVGRRDGRHVGMIEQGRKYVATDDQGVVRGRSSDLAGAESLFDEAAFLHADAAPSAVRRRTWPYVTGGGVVVAGAVAASAVLLLH